MKKKIRKHVGGLEPSKYLTDSQLEKLMEYLRTHSKTRRGHVNHFIVQFLLFTGLRAAELLNMKFRDTSRCHCKNVVLVTRGKGNVSRTILVPEVLQVVVDCYQQECRPGAKPGSFLLVAEGKTRMGYDALLHRLKRIGIESGVGRLRPHMLRHCYAIGLYGVAEDIRFCQDQLGHAHIETTSIYAKTRPESGRKQVEKLPIFGQQSRNCPVSIGKPDVIKALGL
jgi:integrase/recombinase XerD